MNTIMVGNNCNKAGETVWERFDWPPMGKKKGGGMGGCG